MKFARFDDGSKTQCGVVVGDHIIALQELLPDAPDSMTAVLAGGAELRSRIAKSLPMAKPRHALDSVQLKAPITDPQKYLAIGMNYPDHVEEARKGGVTMPNVQVWFNKQVSCINGPFDAIHYPRVATMLDFEAELGVVIGTRCKNVRASDARQVIGGYFICNDVTARDWQFASPTFTLGKSFDTHGPIGPWIVTADEFDGLPALDFRLFVNGEQRQQGNTAQMIYDIGAQIEHLTKVMTLEPGDLIATGTCAGVGLSRGKEGLLKVGDMVRVEIDGIGHIENRVILEPTT